MQNFIPTTRWGSYLYYNAEIVNNGDKIKLRDALGNFLKSPAVKVLLIINLTKKQLYVLLSQTNALFAIQEFGRTLKLLWQQMLTNGFWSTWSQLVDSLDPFGEKNALRELGLAKGVSQEEIKAKYRELSKVICRP